MDNNKKQKAIVTIGISASGKTTWARKQAQKDPSYTVVGRDDIRAMLMGSTDGTVDWDRWQWKREKEVTAIQKKLIKQAAESGQNVIIADTNLNSKYLGEMVDTNEFRGGLLEFLHKLGFEIEFKEFDIDITEAWRRDSRRKNGVGHHVIAQQYELYLEYKAKRGKHVPYDNNTNEAKKLPNAFIFDIDGTLAHNVTGRGWYDRERIIEDAPDEAVVMVLRALRDAGNKILVVTGRDGRGNKVTLRWLEQHNIPYDGFWSRAGGDTRKDCVVKEEIFRNHIEPNYRVLGVFDDRPQVLRSWIKMGVKTFAVGNPWIEF